MRTHKADSLYYVMLDSLNHFGAYHACAPAQLVAARHADKDGKVLVTYRLLKEINGQTYIKFWLLRHASKHFTPAERSFFSDLGVMSYANIPLAYMNLLANCARREGRLP